MQRLDQYAWGRLNGAGSNVNLNLPLAVLQAQYRLDDCDLCVALGDWGQMERILSELMEVVSALCLTQLELILRFHPISMKPGR